MKKANIILGVGAILIALRLLFPVLICDPQNLTCNQGTIDFFSLHPRWDYIIHTERTYMEVVAIGIITLALYFIFKKEKN